MNKIDLSESEIRFKRLKITDEWQNVNDINQEFKEAMELAQSPISNMYAHNLELALTHFRLFEMHTYRPVSAQVFKAVGNTPGIEYIEWKTPYRLVIAIALLYNIKDVKNTIRKRVSEIYRDHNQSVDDLEKLKQEMSQYSLTN